MDIETAKNRHNTIIFYETYQRAYNLLLPSVNLKIRIHLEAFVIASEYEHLYYTRLHQTGNPIYARDLAEELFLDFNENEHP